MWVRGQCLIRRWPDVQGWPTSLRVLLALVVCVPCHCQALFNCWGMLSFPTLAWQFQLYIESSVLLIVYCSVHDPITRICNYLNYLLSKPFFICLPDPTRFLILFYKIVGKPVTKGAICFVRSATLWVLRLCDIFYWMRWNHNYCSYGRTVINS